MGAGSERSEWNQPNDHALISIRGKPRWDTCRLHLYPGTLGTNVNVLYLCVHQEEEAGGRGSDVYIYTQRDRARQLQ